MRRPPVPRSPARSAPKPIPAADEEAGDGRDLRLGAILTDAGVVTPAQLEECLHLQEDLVRQGLDVVPRLGQLLVRRGYASAARIEEALELQDAAGRTCTSCGRHSPALLLDMGDGDRCPHCGTLFELRASTGVHAWVGRIPEGLVPSPAAPPVPPEIGTVGRYQLLREIGRGSMGVVYEALDPALNRRVALKLLHPLPGGEKSDDVRQFLQEARLSGNLPKHPNIVSVYEAGEHAGRHFLAMELIEGRPLSACRKKGSVTLRQQARLLRDVALAVHHAHEHGILHCDLKPQNVMVDEKMRPFVTDFGLARRAGKDPWAALDDGMTMGTPAYMSPEQARGLAEMDRRTDVYSLGIMIYETFAGRLPFRARTAEELLQKTVRDPVRPPSSVARSLASLDPEGAIDAICLKALAKKPRDRYATSKALADDLTRWLKGEAVAVRRPRPKPFPLRTAVLAALLLVAALGAARWMAAPAPPPAPAKADLERVRADLSRKAQADLAALDAERKRLAAIEEKMRTQAVAPAGSRYPIEWLLAGPFENRGLDGILPPEEVLEFTGAMVGKGGPVRWQTGFAALSPAGTGRAAVFDFVPLFTPNTRTVAYAMIHVKAPAEMDVLLLAGSDDGLKVWANGKVIHRHEQGRGVRIDEDEVALKLKAGWNRLLFKVTQWEQGWGLAARFADVQRRPLDLLEYDAWGDLPRPAVGR